jgi:hypothetical protein
MVGMIEVDAVLAEDIVVVEIVDKIVVLVANFAAFEENLSMVAHFGYWAAHDRMCCVIN